MNQFRSDGTSGPLSPRSMALKSPAAFHPCRKAQSIALWMPGSGSELYQDNSKTFRSARFDALRCETAQSENEGLANAAIGFPVEQIVRAYEVHLHRQDAEQQFRVAPVRLHQGGPRIDPGNHSRLIVPEAGVRHKTHLRDLISVGLIDESWLIKLPDELAARLRSLLDTPDG
jgi:hypothetical protein